MVSRSSGRVTAASDSDMLLSCYDAKWGVIDGARREERSLCC